MEPNLAAKEETVPLERPWRTNLLICAATWMELRAWWPREDTRSRLSEGQMAYSPAQTFAVMGVGIPAALTFLLGLLQEVRPARILNIGIAGAYPNSGLTIGDMALGTAEVYGDIGFELPMENPLEDLAPGFQSIQVSPFAGTLYKEPLPLTVGADWPLQAQGYQVRTARGCTVNQCTGTEPTGIRREQMFAAQFESMEGAAAAHVGQVSGIPVGEIRAISNFASTRDMQPDNIRLAIANLRDYLTRCKL